MVNIMASKPVMKKYVKFPVEAPAFPTVACIDAVISFLFKHRILSSFELASVAT